jgi:hypothetical protein
MSGDLPRPMDQDLQSPHLRPPTTDQDLQSPPQPLWRAGLWVRPRALTLWLGIVGLGQAAATWSIARRELREIAGRMGCDIIKERERCQGIVTGSD